MGKRRNTRPETLLINRRTFLRTVALAGGAILIGAGRSAAQKLKWRRPKPLHPAPTKAKRATGALRVKGRIVPARVATLSKTAPKRLPASVEAIRNQPSIRTRLIQAVAEAPGGREFLASHGVTRYIAGGNVSNELAAAARQSDLAKAYKEGLTLTPAGIRCVSSFVNVAALDPEPMAYVGMHGYVDTNSFGRTDRLTFHRYVGQPGSFLQVFFITPRSPSHRLGYIFELNGTGPTPSKINGGSLNWSTTSDGTSLACCNLMEAPYYGRNHTLDFTWPAGSQGENWARFFWLNILAV